ncbi:putative DNA double-strand break repair protein Mre11 [Septoria linicola]|nr:putative DNA double-strand break repair protein Mre11 [Septoria linicola]
MADSQGNRSSPQMKVEMIKSSQKVYTAADTIRILVSTDNHVGYNERDPVRGNDSWQTFDEIMQLAKARDVDMVLLAGDLFHENKPSRQAMYQVMRSLRENCYGNKPCELQMLSDSSEHFAGAFNHVNYDDENINVAIPVFSIHGNHDDPSGEGHLAALDILHAAGLLNYYGRTPESDNIHVKPVLLQKGQTKLALYGMSNVRDERLFRTFRDEHVKFYRPSRNTGDWFNIMSVHQNHHAYTETSYLPERFLPGFLDLVIWGHEHECKIHPEENPEMGFKVMQPGSSVATSLVKGEAVPKHVAIVSVTGLDYECEPIRLKTVRPFIVKEIALRDFPEARKIAMSGEEDNRGKVSKFLSKIVYELIEQARQEWLELQDEGDFDEDDEIPKPIVRLRVETTPPEGGTYTLDNPQRFSSRFIGDVANSTDVVQYHRKRTAIGRKKMDADVPDLEDQEFMKTVTIDTAGVDRLVKEFLTAQSLTILPQNTFSDAVSQFVDKDDKHAMAEFLQENLKIQQDNLLDEQGEDDNGGKLMDDDTLYQTLEKNRQTLDDAYDRGERSRKSRKTIRERPEDWDSDENGHWEASYLSWVQLPPGEEGAEAEDEDDDAASVASSARPTRGRGSRGGRGGKAAAGTTRKTAAAPKKAPAKPAASRGKKKPVSDDEDVIMLDDDDDDMSNHDESLLFVSQASRTQRSASPVKKPTARSTATRATTRGRGRGGAAASRTSATQQTLSFGTQPSGTGRTNGTSRAVPIKRREPSDDEISDDDAFETPPPAQRSTRTGRR